MPRKSSSSKRWPHTQVPGAKRTALVLLEEIVLEAVRHGAPNQDLLVRRALRCAAYAHEFVSEAEHGRLVREARDHAHHARWALAAYTLNH